MEQKKLNKPIQFAIGNTALLTCKMREIETKRQDSLFKDEFAEKLGGKESTQIMEDLQNFVRASNPSSDIADKILMSDLLAVRHRFFDDFILDKISKQTSDRQVIIGAAGFDSRAFRFDWPQDTTVFELDNEGLLRFKEERIETHKMVPKCKRVTIPTDFRDPKWKEVLLSKGYKQDKPAIWIFEGLFGYLPEEAVNKLLREVSDLTAPNSWICCDIGLTDRNEQSENFIQYLKALDAPLLSCMPDPKKTFQTAGWELVKVTHPAECSYSRSKDETKEWPAAYVTACKNPTQA
jgi:methyltransferase (TIGR00027 family)